MGWDGAILKKAMVVSGGWVMVRSPAGAVAGMLMDVAFDARLDVAAAVVDIRYDGGREWGRGDSGKRDGPSRGRKAAGSGNAYAFVTPGPQDPGEPLNSRRAPDRALPKSMDQENALVPSQDRETSWRPILHASNQVVLYNPTSHALTIHHSSHSTTATTLDQPVPPLCPYCSQPLPAGRTERDGSHEHDSPFTNLNRFEDVSGPRASNYFHLLQVANDSASRPPSPPLHSTQSVPSSQSDTRTPSPSGENVFTPESMAEGYFKAFFQEEARLGMGANGSVFLCQVRQYNS